LIDVQENEIILEVPKKQKIAIKLLRIVEVVNMIGKGKNGGVIKGSGKEETINDYGRMDEWMDR
jgi:hypothetical protein